ncbi:hypothetical protein SEEGA711_20226 [Salmonella enterica subsp. enterica serovar Gaminara str. ATCC BAA-711]|nr:hypothetical protein SEEJ0721_09701 [Salmonella enterica subsp. enterica serovar Javiana str. 10721]ESH22451.1 hypothetical protein SEEGA711_20226 [Salmonella enterica subsp. enterica serovar Gaminara str. ATCC BAA-711]
MIIEGSPWLLAFIFDVFNVIAEATQISTDFAVTAKMILLIEQKRH